MSKEKLSLIMVDAALHQLKAHYIGQADQNLHSLLSCLPYECVHFDLSLPEWVIPLCALVAAMVSAFHVVRWAYYHGLNTYRTLQRWRRRYWNRWRKHWDRRRSRWNASHHH
jgi:hypothetical protein